ncbi:MAG: Fpg/Nei family DNA glycosylase [Actinomycetaceae bacterium]|nr:Fpg/Nei family DNA glycosylase [Actinomycetaceae bacterium]
MPEGHVIHRQAAQLGEAFAGQSLEVSSPQGRFNEGADLLDGLALTMTRAHGKHLFLGFAPPESNASTQSQVAAADAASPGESFWEEAALWVHIHLGLYGKWRWHQYQEQVPSPRGQVRLRLVGESVVADLSGPNRCEILNPTQSQAIIDRLGPDPLDPQPGDRERFICSVRSRSRAVGELVMDQSVVAGPGNIYRAECLFRTEINPFRAGSRVSAKRLGALWDDLMANLERGRREGIIVTIDDADRPDPSADMDEEAQRFYVYHRGGRACLLCGGRIGEQLMAGRRLFWCPRCQR